VSRDFIAKFQWVFGVAFGFKLCLIKDSRTAAMTFKLLTLLVCTAVSVFDVAAAFRAGVAVRNVTPDPLLPVSGGVGPSHPVTRKESELTVRARIRAGQPEGRDRQRGFSWLPRVARQPGASRGQRHSSRKHFDWGNSYPKRAGLLRIP
jgi:hypothetical protein